MPAPRRNNTSPQKKSAGSHWHEATVPASGEITGFQFSRWGRTGRDSFTVTRHPMQ